MVCYRKVLSSLLCLLLLHQNESTACPAGQRLNYNTKSCEPCPPQQFNPKGGTGNFCLNCSKCKRGSKQIEHCTSTSDAKCTCMPGFTPIDQLNEICICKKGFGIKKEKECRKCGEGLFTDKEDSICRKWKECKGGTAIPGNSTSDAVCKDASKEVTEAPKTHTTPFRTTTVSTPLQKTTTSTTFQTTTVSSTAVSRTTNSSTYNSKENTYSLWLVMLFAGILLLAGLLYHKCKVTHCIHNHRKVDFRKESECRKPVEESGEKCLSLLV
ncbi:tumor necrosis factor receptor superfamily member 1B [Garra rufa]|uniref:tumor necrosis factor receptor superfamily member 1B n=1 Tax=Garra rufa TaxID=137080 RepID=UPI003CCEA848